MSNDAASVWLKGWLTGSALTAPFGPAAPGSSAQRVPLRANKSVSLKPLLGCLGWTVSLTGLHVTFLEGWVQHLVAPVLLGEVLQRAAVRLHLLVQPAAVDEHRSTALGVPAPLSKHLLQLLDGVAALPFADPVFLHSTVATAQRLDDIRRNQLSSLYLIDRWIDVPVEM